MTPTRKYAVLAWKGLDPTPNKIGHADPLAVLGIAVEYLKAGYQVRLNDITVRYFAEQPAPDPELRAALTENGQAAVFSGPPQIP